MPAPVGTWSSPYDYAANFQYRFPQITNTAIRSRVLFMLMQQAGAFKPASGGNHLEWVVHMRNPKPTGFSVDSVPNYGTSDSKRTAKLGWAQYQYGIKLDRAKLQMNKGQQAFFDVFKDATDEVESAFRDRWPEVFYQNADNTSVVLDPKPLAGFYTWLGKYSTSTAATDQGFQNKVRLYSGTYAGLTMNLGTESGDWAGPDGDAVVSAASAAADTRLTATNKWWPSGQGDPAYDFWHPLCVKTKSPAWGSDPDFNEIYCERMLQFGIRYSKRTGQGDKGPINLILTGTENMLTLESRFSSTYRTIAQVIQKPGGPNAVPGPGEGEGMAYSKPIYQFGGCLITDDYDMPNNADLIGVNLANLCYQPCHAYDQQSGTLPFMEPHVSDIPGGLGKFVGGFNMGQLLTYCARNWVLWSPLV